MLRVGLTGGIGAGKSEVSKRLAAQGAIVIDADAIAREVVAPGTPGLTQVIAMFGEDLLRPDGSLDRERLGEIVFADKATDPEGRVVYENRVVLFARTRWGRITYQEDFLDTQRVDAFDEYLEKHDAEKHDATAL